MGTAEILASLRRLEEGSADWATEARWLVVPRMVCWQVCAIVALPTLDHPPEAEDEAEPARSPPPEPAEDTPATPCDPSLVSLLAYARCLVLARLTVTTIRLSQ